MPKTDKQKWDDKDPKQIKRFINGDIECERHEYQGPQGSGYVDYCYKTVDGKNMVKMDHYGPESRKSHGWTEIIEDDL